MSNRIFVGGLNWSTTQEGLRQAFEKFGAISETALIVKPETGHSRGYGFITFEKGEDAAKAIAAMNGSELDGAKLTVNQATSKGPRGGRRSDDSADFGGGYGGGGYGGGYGGGRRDRW